MNCDQSLYVGVLIRSNRQAIGIQTLDLLLAALHCAALPEKSIPIKGSNIISPVPDRYRAPIKRMTRATSLYEDEALFLMAAIP
jgi:hypothetical protein